MAVRTSTKKHEHCKSPQHSIYLFVPNVIGYVRILLLICSSRLLFFDYYLEGAFIYMVNITFDYIDGYYARKLNQCTSFGGLFDTVIDLLSVTVLSIHIVTRYPQYMCFVLIHLTIDLGFEWISTCAHATNGDINTKNIISPVLKFYFDSLIDYTWYFFNILLCVIYISSYTMGPIVPVLSVHLLTIIIFISTPFAVTRFLMLFLRMKEALIIYQDVHIKRSLDVQIMGSNGHISHEKFT